MRRGQTQAATVQSRWAGGIGKMVKDGNNGFSCEPMTEAFLKRIKRYIQHPELFRVHGDINRPLVEPLSARGTAKFFSKYCTRGWERDVVTEDY